MSVFSTLFCVVVLLVTSSIHAHVVSPSRHLTGIQLDRVIDITKSSPTEAPTPSPTPKSKKTFVIDVDDVHGQVVLTTEPPVKKKRKRPDLHAWSKDNKDKSEVDPKIINQLIADASTPDEIDGGQPPVKIVKLKDTKGRTRPPPTEPPTLPPTKPAPRKLDPPAGSSTESQEEAAHEEEVEEESRLKRMRKTNRVKGQESVRDYEREHAHEDEKQTRQGETISHEDNRDTERDQRDDTHEQDPHHSSHDDTHDDTLEHSSSDNTHTSSSSDTEVHSAIPFEPVDEHMKEILHWTDDNKTKDNKKQWTWDKEIKDERKKQSHDIHDQTQTSTLKKRNDDVDDHSYDHIERRSRRDDDTHDDETPRRTRKDESDTHDQHDDTPREIRHDEDTPQPKATWEWKDEKNSIKKYEVIPKSSTSSKAKATPVPKTGHDAVDRLVANMAADFAAHLEAEKAAGHDVTHLTVGDTKSSSKSDKPYVPPIHHDNLAHHDYVDPDKVQFADSIVKWHAPAAPPAIKVVDETAIEREADGTVHLRGAKPPAEGGPAGIDLALP